MGFFWKDSRAPLVGRCGPSWRAGHPGHGLPGGTEGVPRALRPWVAGNAARAAAAAGPRRSVPPETPRGATLTRTPCPRPRPGTLIGRLHVSHTEEAGSSRPATGDKINGLMSHLTSAARRPHGHWNKVAIRRMDVPAPDAAPKSIAPFIKHRSCTRLTEI